MQSFIGLQMSLTCILNRSLFYLSDQLNLDFLWSLVGSCKSQTGKTSSGELKDSVQFQKGIGQDEGINKHLALNSFSDTPLSCSRQVYGDQTGAEKF
jgi:hypothetical protein